MSVDTWYVDTAGSLRVRPLKLVLGEEKKQSIDWNAYVGSKESTVSSVTFTSESDSVVDITNATLSSGVSTVEMLAEAEGSGMVSAAVTLSSGEVLVRKFLVSVIDPQASSDTAYQ